MTRPSTSIPDFDRQLTAALRPEAAPEDLRRSLLRAAEPSSSRWAWRALGMAALLMLFLGGGTWGLLVRWRGQEGVRFARTALQDYQETRPMDFTVAASTPDSGELSRQWSTEAVGFSATLPKCLAEQAVKGACACAFASCQAVCFHLLDGRAIYIFERPLRGLSADPNRPHQILAANHRVQAWNEDGRGYVLVEPPGWGGAG